MGGVCLALANYMNLDVTLVRVIWLLLALLPVPGPFVLAYFVCWIVFPAQEELPVQAPGNLTTDGHR